MIENEVEQSINLVGLSIIQAHIWWKRKSKSNWFQSVATHQWRSMPKPTLNWIRTLVLVYHVTKPSPKPMYARQFTVLKKYLYLNSSHAGNHTSKRVSQQ